MQCDIASEWFGAEVLESQAPIAFGQGCIDSAYDFVEGGANQVIFFQFRASSASDQERKSNS
jgi:hypothetical protein